MNWFTKLFSKQNRNINYISAYQDGLLFGRTYTNIKPMQLASVYRCVSLISDSIAMLPIRVQKNGVDLFNHPLYQIFNDLKSTSISKFNLLKQLLQDVMLNGNGYCYIDRDQNFNVLELKYISPNDVQISLDKGSGEKYYKVASLKAMFDSSNILHFYKNSTNGVSGVSNLSYASSTLKLSQSTESAAQDFFDSGCNLSGVLTVQGVLSEQQKQQIRQSWNEAYKSGGGGLAVLQGNMKYEPTKLSSKDSQLLESREFNNNEICKFFDLNPSMLDGTNSNIEQTQTQFLVQTLMPYIYMLESELKRKLLKPSERKISIFFETTEILRTDKTSMANYLSTLLSNGILSINECRFLLGYKPISGGEKHIIPFTDISQNQIENNNQDNNNTNGEQQQ